MQLSSFEIDIFQRFSIESKMLWQSGISNQHKI